VDFNGATEVQRARFKVVTSRLQRSLELLPSLAEEASDGVTQQRRKANAKRLLVGGSIGTALVLRIAGETLSDTDITYGDIFGNLGRYTFYLLCRWYFQNSVQTYNRYKK